MDGAKEWQVTMPDQAAPVHPPRAVSVFKTKLSDLAKPLRKMIGADDRRKRAYRIKVAIALTLVSLFYYVRPLYDGVGDRNTVWAIMTVVLVFEHTVGGSLYKGFNRTAGTTIGAAFALGLHWVASRSGKRFEPVVAGASVCLLGAVACSRFLPVVKALYDYGVTVFIMTYSFLAVSGYRVEDLAVLGLQRILTVAIGFVICIAVCVLVRPVWSGEELHLLAARNMDKLAGALAGCVEDRFSGHAKCVLGSKGYRCVLASKAAEDSHADLARWEPAHGRFGFRYPYHLYAKVGDAMRRCAHCVEALDGCVGAASEQAPRLLADACTKVGTQCARVLKEASSSVAAMTISRTLGFALADMNTAVQELQRGLRALPSKLADEPTETSLTQAMALLPVALLLIEISARVDDVVAAVDALASVAGFKTADDDKAETNMGLGVPAFNQQLDNHGKS